MALSRDPRLYARVCISMITSIKRINTTFCGTKDKLITFWLNLDENWMAE
jgi:hypothetical protein